MADIRGIELASDIYGLQDTSARTDTEKNTSAIGTLANLNTTAKTNLVSAINEVNGKAENNEESIETLQQNLSDLDSQVQLGICRYVAVSSISDIRGLQENRVYLLRLSADIDVVDDGGTSTTITAGSFSIPFLKTGGDERLVFYNTYPIGQSAMWGVFLNSNGQNRGKKIV